MKKLTIIIPCYNEEGTVAELLKRVEEASMPGWEKEIIAVDDASEDNTPNILKNFENGIKVIYREKNGGKGTAIQQGAASATGDYVLIQDADLEYDPEDIKNLLETIDNGEADVVYGSRNLNPDTKHGDTIPRIGVWFITKLINTLYELKLTDVWTCYKLFPHGAVSDLKTGKFESELLFTGDLARRGYRFKEVAISYNPRLLSEGKKIRYRDGIEAIVLIIIDWIRHLGAKISR